ncbi:hypothetical protein SCHPADRAFT_888766 [Schizopora paradoxa]|uniref:Uncharacterized protein n=1 Tax=Schizopora paradoxa TaxID=27342 RepID=A0A0H2S072_9AGAM|nr:hypothetical protein SCHPADRAFT_888766 [Schizopora paradoxa]
MLYFPPPSDDGVPPPYENDTPPPAPIRQTTSREPVEREIERGISQGTQIAGSDLQSENHMPVDRVDTQQALIDKLVSELHEVKKQLKEKEDAYDSLKEHYNLESILHNQREAELRALVSPFVRGDEVTAEEISRSFQDLNRQMLEIAQTCSDPVRLQDKFGKPKEKDRLHKPEDPRFTNEMSTNLQIVLGGELLRSIALSNALEDQLLVQYAMQSIVCLFVKLSYQTYPFSCSRKAGTIGKTVFLNYLRMHEKESQAITSLWRSLTSEHFTSADSSKEVQEYLRLSIVQYFARVLFVAGVHEDYRPLVQYCNVTIGPKAREICASVAKFAQTLKERVFSTDYVLTAPSFEDKFDASTMKSRHIVPEAIERSSGEKILCTTELGLLRRTKLKGASGGNGLIEKNVIQKATIVFEWEMYALGSPGATAA